MLPNTYDVPAYKFALVKFDDDILRGCDDWNAVSDFMVDNPSRCHIIPFENFDGLTAKELKSLFCQEHNNFYFVGYNSMSYIRISGKRENYNSVLFSLLVLNLDEDVRIDESIKNYMINSYKTYDAQTQRLFRCFLERYCYRSQDEVSEMIR